MRAHYLNTRAFGRLAAILAIGCLLSLNASAYTVIMRSGRRVEVPAHFLVTENTLTYELSPSVQVTLQLDAIDIAATEKANNERPGSLRARALDVHRPSVAQDVAPAATKTITNRDLESSMRRRQESQVAYERRRKELGLPSLEESRRKEAAESKLIAGELAETRAAQQQSESYWRARASALRTEIASVDAQLAYVRRQLEQPDILVSNGSLGFFAVPAPFRFGTLGRNGGSFEPLTRPGVFVSPRGGTRFGGSVHVGGNGPHGRVLINPIGSSRSFGMNSFWRPRSYNNVLVPISQDFGVFNVRGQLICEFNELSLALAGLNAQWRELEDEARRAGAPPGWLRP